MVNPLYCLGYIEIELYRKEWSIFESIRKLCALFLIESIEESVINLGFIIGELKKFLSEEGCICFHISF